MVDRPPRRKIVSRGYGNPPTVRLSCGHVHRRSHSRWDWVRSLRCEQCLDTKETSGG